MGSQWVVPHGSVTCPRTDRSCAHFGMSMRPPKRRVKKLHAMIAHARDRHRGNAPTSIAAMPTAATTPGSWVSVKTNALPAAWSSLTWVAMAAASTAPDTTSKTTPAPMASARAAMSARVRGTPQVSTASLSPRSSDAARLSTRWTTAVATRATITTVSNVVYWTTGRISGAILSM